MALTTMPEPLRHALKVLSQSLIPKKMAEKILEYRATIPYQLKTTFDSILSTQRPNLSSLEYGFEPVPSREHNTVIDHEEAEFDKKQQNEEKIRLLEEKISSNISAMPFLNKRMKECFSRIEKLDSCNDPFVQKTIKVLCEG